MPDTAGSSSLMRKSWVWMLIAVVAVGALMAWLSVEAERARTEVVIVEESPDIDDDEDEVEWIELEGIAAEPGEFTGRPLRVENIEVISVLGPRGFWAAVEDQSPILVLLAPDLTEEPEVSPHDTFHIRGYVGIVTDSAMDEWVQSRVIVPEARDQVEFATHYLFGERAIRPRDAGRENGPEEDDEEE